MTPAELFDAREAYTESQGGTSHRARQGAWQRLRRLKERYPDRPAEAGKAG